jgi:competence protein ComEC
MFRRTALLNSVGLAALAILIARPSELADPSFQLSFLAALTIAGVAAPILSRTAEHYRRALSHLGDVTRDAAAIPRAAQLRLDLRAATNWLATSLPHPLSRFSESAITTPCRAVLRLWELVVISLAIQIGMLPLMAQYFHRISLAGLAANIPAVLLTAIIVPFGFLALGVGMFWRGLAYALGHVLFLAVGVLVTSVDWFARSRWASFRVPSPPGPLLVAFFVAGVLFSMALLAAWRWTARLAVSALLAFATLIAAYPFSPRLARGQLEVTILDVGQGDSIFVAFPNGRTMLVDGGGLPGSAYIRGNRPGIEVGEDVVSPYLWTRGLQRIDVVALTHAHEDHLGGLPAVLRNFRVGQLWVGRDVESANYRGLLAQAMARGVPVIHRVAGERFDWDRTQMRVLWPDTDDVVKNASNDDSLVLRLADGRESFLLTGDIERPVERGLLTQQANDSQSEGELAADFLKVPHHGSKTSSTQPFLDAVHPRFAAISVGASNTFGQPNAEVIDRISAEGARVFRTDRDGAITALTDGNALSVRSFVVSQSDSQSSSPPLSSYRSSSITSPDTSSRSSAPAR